MPPTQHGFDGVAAGRNRFGALVADDGAARHTTGADKFAAIQQRRGGGDATGINILHAAADGRADRPAAGIDVLLAVRQQQSVARNAARQDVLVDGGEAAAKRRRGGGIGAGTRLVQHDAGRDHLAAAIHRRAGVRSAGNHDQFAAPADDGAGGRAAGKHHLDTATADRRAGGGAAGGQRLDAAGADARVGSGAGAQNVQHAAAVNHGGEGGRRRRQTALPWRRPACRKRYRRPRHPRCRRG